MEIINDIYYKGYEGEPEIQFIALSSNGKRKILSIWDGYFDDIMQLFEPSETGWNGLAYYYHLCSGWSEESPWKLPDLEESLQQFKSLNLNKCRFEKSKDVLLEICKLILDAIEQHETVWIAEE